METGKKRVHLIIHGRVQGVWFRASTQEVARRLGIQGWVRNRRDGTVEVLAEGDEAKIEELVAWCHEGPPGAVVIRVDRTDHVYQGDMKGFEVKYTL